MGKNSVFALATALACTIAAPRAAFSQTYKVEKYNIGGDGGTDYLTADPASGRVFVSRSTHVMVVDGATGKVLGDIKDTPRVHGIAFSAEGRPRRSRRTPAIRRRRCSI